MSEHAEDDENVTDNGDGDETTQDENGENSLPTIILKKFWDFLRYHSLTLRSWGATYNSKVDHTMFYCKKLIIKHAFLHNCQALNSVLFFLSKAGGKFSFCHLFDAIATLGWKPNLVKTQRSGGHSNSLASLRRERGESCIQHPSTRYMQIRSTLANQFVKIKCTIKLKTLSRCQFSYHFGWI